MLLATLGTDLQGLQLASAWCDDRLRRSNTLQISCDYLMILLSGYTPRLSIHLSYFGPVGAPVSIVAFTAQ